MKKVFVSGCYDILHAGHIQFFEDAKKLGDHLTVCFASDRVLLLAKGRRSSIPESHKAVIISSLRCVVRVVKSSNLHPFLDFTDHLKRDGYDILAATEDDKHSKEKQALCKKYGIQYIVIKKYSRIKPISTTRILNRIRDMIEVPLRIDFAGGWLDVPKLSKPDAYIVNCTITPKVSLDEWPYEKRSGLGGSAAYSILQAKNGIRTELDLGVGWQDPAVITETGLCVWRSGKRPVLEAKYNPDWLNGKLLILWTNASHDTPNMTRLKRDYELIRKAGILAREAVKSKDLGLLAEAVSLSYKVQKGEGMEDLLHLRGALACKYLGGGHGGYALYIFNSKKARDMALKANHQTKKIEPYIKLMQL
ncbi:MAG: adenylyltransferase/cytidyltransferase family protein [Candidatus Omnitrophota bacterium]|jgi:cytidyltransferase-like protein